MNCTIEVEKNGKRVVVYDPLPHQREFHESTARYTLLHGGRGSGKSKAIRAEAFIGALTVPGFKALILRRSAPELKKSHLVADQLPMEMSALGLPPSAFHQTDMVLRIPWNHSLIQFGHVEDDHALTKWLSTQWEAILIDEVTTFTHQQFTWLMTSLRTTIPGLVPYFKGGTNPVGPGAGWVRDLWITRAAALDPEKYPAYRPEDYHAIQANLDDNPYVDPENYAKVFEGISSEALRNALRYGEWTTEGQMFSEFRMTRDGKPWHVIEELPRYQGKPIIEWPHYEVVRSIDWGYKDFGVCLWAVILPDGSAIVFKEWFFKEMTPEDVAKEILRRSEGLKVRYTVADYQMMQEHTGPSIAEEFAQAGLSLIEADKNRKAGWVQLHTWLRDELDHGQGPFPRLRFLRSGCPRLIRAIPEMVIDEKDPEDIVSRGVDDHGPDALRYLVMSRLSPSREPKPPKSPARAEIDRLIARKRRSAGRLGSEATRRGV